MKRVARLLHICLCISLGATMVLGCGGPRAGTGTEEGDACAAPEDCDEGFDCLENQCRAVEDEACDCNPRGERCVAGVCQQVDVVTVNLEYEEDILSNDSFANTTICTRRPVRAEPEGDELLLRDDECVAYKSVGEWQPTHEPVEYDLGTVTLAINGAEPEEVNKHDGDLAFLKGCYTSHEIIDEGIAFRPGDELELHLSGSAEFPELTISSTVPESIRPTPSDLVRGEPLEVSWEPADDADPARLDAVTVVVEQRDGSDFVYAACRTADDGEFTVPGEFTALLPDTPPPYTLHVNRRHTQRLTHEDTSMTVFVNTRAATDDMPLSSP